MSDIAVLLDQIKEAEELLQRSEDLAVRYPNRPSLLLNVESMRRHKEKLEDEVRLMTDEGASDSCLHEVLPVERE